MKKRFVFIAILIAMVVLTLLPASLVNAEDIGLNPISGSDCDPRTFEYQEHTIAEGFAASISADLPLIDGRITKIKFGCAVAGLGESWYRKSPYYYAEYTPYVKEMRVKVEGKPPYTADEWSIYDNTGTGGSSSDTFSVVFTLIGVAFNAWQIYDWLAEIYQEPPVAEWNDDGHWSEAIIRQKTEPAPNPPGGRWVDSNGPLLQTASAEILSYFEEGSSYVLNVTAEADIYLQKWNLNSNYVGHEHIGTYRVSFEVNLGRTLSISATEGGTTDPAPGTYTYDYGSSVAVTAVPDDHYEFDYWLLDGDTYYQNPITVTMDSDHTLEAHFVKLVDLVVGVPQAPLEGVKVWVDGTTYTAYATTPVSVTVTAGQHTIEAQKSFIKEEWKPGEYYIYTFYCWSDGSTANPRTITLTSDTTLTANYLRSKYGILIEANS